MSVSHTEAAVRDRSKTVTRRLGWLFLRPGDRLTLCRKVMGRKAGEPLVRLAEVEVVDVRRERLWDITAADVALEAVPLLYPDSTLRFDEYDVETGQPTPAAWVQWFVWEMGCGPLSEVTRIELANL